MFMHLMKLIRKKNAPISSAFIFVANTLELSSILNKLKDSIWWNHQARYFIVNENSLNSCQMASAMLKVAWNFNLFSVVYLCIDSENRMVLYTFNHFASMDPKPWREAQQKLIGSPWSLFKLSTERAFELFEEGKRISLARIEIRKCMQQKSILRQGEAVAWLQFKSLYSNKANVGYERFDGLKFRIMSTALKRINATLTVKDSAADGYMDTDGYKI
ncbi:hypothetical protein TSAR_001870 [Trichomalopsis sarcophagae]|uniref:Uncharacterized protein n=1 Tax=Trichomalopsis sarcophagae TaxID=543379 RepID=A0A232EV06_9HYME|nr:hypothetical protein TSAR_001870 [Trichomalopsis sarcophagae]